MSVPSENDRKVSDFILDIEYDGIRASDRRDKYDELCEWVRESPYSSMDFSFLTDESIARTIAERETSW